MASSAPLVEQKGTSLPNWKCSLLLSEERLRDRNEANPMTIEMQTR